MLFQYLRDKKKKEEGSSEKRRGGGENSPISPPLDPRLPLSESEGGLLNLQCDCFICVFSSRSKHNLHLLFLVTGFKFYSGLLRRFSFISNSL